MKQHHIQIARFLVTGSLTVGIDFTVYRFLWLLLGTPVDGAKLTGFLAGTMFAWFANRLWTFARDKKPARGGPKTAGLFLAVYLFALGINVAVNHGMLVLLGLQRHALIIAFVAATAVSATLNFLGMKFLAFRA